jgi:hypothetical protein
MTSRLKSVFKFVLSAGLTLGFLYLAFRGTDFSKLYEAIRSANYWWMAVMFILMMASHFVRAWRWRYLLEPIKPNIGIRNLFSGVMVGYLMNNILPRAGELVRPYAIGKLENIPKTAAFGTIVVERIIDTFSFLILVVLVPLVYDGPLVETFPWLERAGYIVTAVTVILLLIALVLMLRRDWTDRLLGMLTRFLPARIMARVERMTHSFLDGFLFLKNPGNFLMILAQSVMVWGLYIIMLYAALYAFNLQSLGLDGAMVVQAISSIGYAMPTPGATGSYHILVSQTLTKLFGVNDELALSYATITHAVSYIGMTLVGLYYFLRDHIRMSEAVAKQGESAG